ITEVYMNITINGDVYITNYGQTLDELTEGMEFDEFGEFDDCDYCDDCDYDFFEDFDEEDDYIFLMDEIVDMYVDLLSEGCTCEECTKDILLEFLSEVISLAREFQE
ncbi:MAG TPA: hypothetical protein VFC69_04615, partial [Dysgonamonadaceae bacterium]|nr:hypothetical protein [Dysgonamonadaceae bacterium]